MIDAANHVGNLHQRVIHHHHVVVDRNAAGTHDNQIAHRFIGKLNIPAYDVVKANRVLGNPEPDGGRLSCRAALFRFSRIEGAALAGVKLRLLLGDGALAVGFQLLFRAEAQVSFVLAQQLLGVIAVDLQPIALAVWAIRAAAGLRDNVRPLVPIQAQPLQVFK